MSTSFERKLAGGEAWERHICDWLNLHAVGSRGMQHWFRKIEGKCHDWDLYCDHCSQGVEVKMDGYINYSNNYCFELPLLKNSKAKWLFYGTHAPGWQDDKGDWHWGDWHDWVLVVEMDELRAWLREQILLNTGAAYHTKGGDTNHDMWLVSKWKVKQIPTARFVNLKTFKTLELM